MKTERLRSLSIVAAVSLATLIVFLSGMFTAQVIAHGGVMPALVEMAQIVPGVYSAESGSDIPAATNLTPLKTFWRARQRIIDNFVYPEKIEQNQLTYGAIQGMLGSLGDPYSRFMDPTQYADFQTETEGHLEGIGAELDMERNPDTGEMEVVVYSVLPEGPASKTDLAVDDAILAVDGNAVRGKTLNQVVQMIRGEAGTVVKLIVRHKDSDDASEIAITRARVEIPIVQWRMLDDGIGYLWLRSFNRVAAVDVQKGLDALKQQGMKALLFDLSSDPGGMLDQAVAVSSLFLDNTPVTYIRDRTGASEALLAQPGIMLDQKIPMVVLIDRGSASASEIVAGALQDTGRATIVGSPSYGKSKVQTVIELEDGSAMVLTTAVYLTPKKRDISGDEDGKRGVQPDVRFPDPPEDADEQTTPIEWHDQQVERAAAVLRDRLAAAAH